MCLLATHEKTLNVVTGEMRGALLKALRDNAVDGEEVRTRDSKGKMPSVAQPPLVLYSNISSPRFTRNLLARRFAHRRQRLWRNS